MIAFEKSLTAYVEQVLLARDVTPDYANKIRYSVRRFCDWIGCDPGITALDCQLVNEFLVHLQEGTLRPDTVAGYRRALMVVWNEAYQAGDNNTPPLRVRKIRCPRDTVEALSHFQIGQLLTFATSLAGFFPNGIRRADFWTATIHSAYGTGLRRGDLLRVKRSQIDERGVARVLQNKTKYPVTVRFPERAIEVIDRMRVDDRALPWCFHENALSRQFRRLAFAAGVGHAQFRFLRRSAGSYCEKMQPGAGPKLLGHRREQTFRDFYDAPAITQSEPIQPPPLL